MLNYNSTLSRGINGQALKGKKIHNFTSRSKKESPQLITRSGACLKNYLCTLALGLLGGHVHCSFPSCLPHNPAL